MAKNPAERYQSVQEMVEAVFGAEHIQQSVSCFSPDSLSMIAQRVGQRIAVGGGSATPPPIPAGGAAVATKHSCATGDRIGRLFDRLGDRMGAVGNRVADLGVHALPRHALRNRSDEPIAEAGDALCDPLSKRQRRVLALIMLLVIAAAAAILGPIGRRGDGPVLSFWATILSCTGATLGMLIAGHRILPQMTSDSGFLRRLASGGTAGALLMLFGMPVFAATGGGEEQTLAMTALGALIALLLIPPPDLSPSREERMAFGPAVGAAAIGFLAWIFTHGSFPLLIAILAGSHLLTQILSPWDPFAARRRMGLGGDSSGAPPTPVPPTPAGPAAGYDWALERGAGIPAHGGDAPTMAWPPHAPAARATATAPAQVSPAAAPGKRPVPVYYRYLWLAAALLFIPSGIALLVTAASSHGSDVIPMYSIGVGLLAFAALGLVKMWQSTYRTFWRYAGRYFVAWLCLVAFLFAAFTMAEGRLNDGEAAFAVFVMILMPLLVGALMFVRFTAAGPAVELEHREADGGTDEAAAPAAAPVPPLPPIPPPPPAARRPHARDRARWHEAHAWRVKGPPFYVRFFNFVRGLVVGTSLTALLLLATAAWVFIAMNVPGMLAAGIPDRDIPAEMSRSFGFSKWPDVLLAIAYVLAWGSLLLAAAVIVVARRNTYGGHILRGLLGVAVFGAALAFLDRSIHGSWDLSNVAAPASYRLSAGDGRVVMRQDAGGTVTRIDVEHDATHDAHEADRGARDADAERVAEAFQLYLGAAGVKAFPVAGGVALFGMVLMCWPPRSSRDADRLVPALDEPPARRTAGDTQES